MKLKTMVKHSKFSLYATLIVLILCFTVVSCSKPVSNKNYKPLKNFAFQQLLFNQKKPCEMEKPEKYYYHHELNTFFLRHQIDSKGIRYLIEVLNPEYAGYLESSGFYNDYNDSGEWIESVLNEIEMDLYGDFSINRPYDYIAGSDGFEVTSVDSVTKRWIASNKRLNLMKFENEVFIPIKKDNNYILINSTEKQTTRSFYSEDFLLQKKEFWNIINAYESALLTTEEYIYDSNTKAISKKTVTSDNSSVITLYNDKKLPSRTDVYKIEGKNKYLKSRTLWRYNDNGKINIEETTEFFYENNIYNEYSDKITKRQTYTYKTDENIPPDYRYHENGKLKMKTLYQTKSDYMTQVYFDEGYSVQSYFEDSIRRKDVYLMDGVVRRVKNYE